MGILCGKAESTVAGWFAGFALSGRYVECKQALSV